MVAEIPIRPAKKARPATTSVGDSLKSCRTASPSLHQTLSNRTRSTCLARSSNSNAAKRCGAKPAKAKKPTTTLSASSPKPKQKSPPRQKSKNTEIECDPNQIALWQLGLSRVVPAFPRRADYSHTTASHPGRLCCRLDHLSRLLP